MINENWTSEGVVKDVQSITKDWKILSSELIDGVSIREVKNVPKLNGYLTEVFRQDWFEEPEEIDQVFQVVVDPRGLSAWHVHRVTTDRLFVNTGLMRIVLYDDRPESSTFSRINEFRLGSIRPGLVIIPPCVWHGIQNIGSEPSAILNLVDKAYTYEDPDHWRLPPDSDQIPFSFSSERPGDM